jgi:hypothetical protein
MRRWPPPGADPCAPGWHGRGVRAPHAQRRCEGGAAACKARPRHHAQAERQPWPRLQQAPPRPRPSSSGPASRAAHRPGVWFARRLGAAAAGAAAGPAEAERGWRRPSSSSSSSSAPAQAAGSARRRPAQGIDGRSGAGAGAGAPAGPPPHHPRSGRAGAGREPGPATARGRRSKRAKRQALSPGAPGADVVDLLAARCITAGSGRAAATFAPVQPL